MNQYLIPANTKKGQLIISIFRPIDLAIFLTGVSVTLVFLVILANVNADSWITVMAVFPALVAVGLVFPIPNYHNVLVAIQEMISFYTNNRNYKWRGWCAEYESKRNSE